MLNQTVLNQFLTNTDETGRFIVTSKRTGKKYFVEPIANGHTPDWGSIDPATGNLMNKKGFDKYTGGIKESESLIKEDNGFKNIVTLDIGTSPFSYIDMVDSKYPSVN